MLEKILGAASLIVQRFHKVIICLFVLVTVLAGFVVYHTEIKTDLIDVLPSGNPVVAQFKDFIQKYSVTETVTLVITAAPGSIDEHIDLIEALAERLKKSSLIEHVDHSVLGKKNDFLVRNFTLNLDNKSISQIYERLSPAGLKQQMRRNYEQIISPIGAAAEAEIIMKDPLNLRQIISSGMKRSATDNPFDLTMGYYITKDHSAALIFVKPAGSSKNIAFVSSLRDEFKSIIAQALKESGKQSIVKVALTGGHILADDVREVIWHDVLVSAIVSVVLIGFIIWLGYRVRPVVLVIIACSTISSLVLTLATAYLIFGSLNIVTSIVCALLIGMYVDYCILTLKRFGDEILLTGSRTIALEKTMTKAGSSMLISALTTSLSFFSIVLTRFDGLYQLGIVSGIGVLLCFLVTFFFMNSMLFIIASKGAGSLIMSDAPSVGIEYISALIRKYPRRVALSSFAVSAMLLVGIGNISFDNSPEKIGLRDSEAVATMRLLNNQLRNSGEPLQIMVKGRSTDELAGRFEHLEQILLKWKQEGLISKYDSLGSVLPLPGKQLKIIKAKNRVSGARDIDASAVEARILSECEAYGMVCDQVYLKKYLAAVLAPLNSNTIIGLADISNIKDSSIRRFYNAEDRSMVAYIYSGSNGWTAAQKHNLKEQILRRGEGWYLLGTPILYDEIKVSILWGSLFAAIATLSLNLILVIIFLRNIRYSMLAMLPVCLGFLLTPAIIGWLGEGFNFINIGTMALIFGFGVDYGIYIMQSYLREDIKDIDHALRLSGKNVLMCAATTIAGCGSLITASFAGIASIGLVLTVGAICCSVITLVLLPSLLWLNERTVGNEKV